MSLRSTYSPQKRSITRHIKRISEVSIQDNPLEEDLLSQLRKYRRQKSKNTVIEESLSKTEKKLNSYLRPGSAGQPNTIFSSLKTQELIPLNLPTDKKSKTINTQVFLEQSVDRLYRGSRPQTQSIDLQKTALFQLADVVSEKKVEEIEAKLKAADEQTNKIILDELIFLRSLWFDLELNWEIARGKELQPNQSLLGVYFTLEEKLRNAAKIGPINSFSLEPILNELKECSRLFRDVLRGIMAKGAEDEGVLMEMLWKVLFRIIDSCIGKHEYALNSVIECTKSKLKITNETLMSQLREQSESFQTQKNALDKELAAYKEQVSFLTHEKSECVRLIQEKTRTIIELTEIESQEKACVELRSLLGKLSSYITESETEQTKQVNTLNHLSFVIGAADILRDKPKTVDQSSQTSIQVSESYLPELEKPVFSRYPLFPVLAKNVKGPVKFNAVTLCSSAFEECDGQKQFYVELIIYLLSMYRDKETLFLNLRGIYQQLMNEQSFQARLYFSLLSNSKRNLLKVEQNMFKLANLFEKNSESGLMNFAKFVEFLQSFLPDEKTFCEEILENVTQNFSEKDWHAIIEHRFLMVYEKLPKNIKVLIEHDGISLNEFTDWAKNKLMIWATDREIHSFFKTKTSTNAGTWFNFEVSERIKETKIEKENFLLGFLKVSLSKFSRFEKESESIERTSEYLKFKEVILQQNKDLSERLVSNCFAEILLGTPFEEVQEKVLDFDFAGLKITESPRPKKKAPIKSPKKSKK